jgi:transposase-like protein
MKKQIYTSEFKTRLVLEVMREERTISEIAAKNGINPNQLGNWKREFMQNAYRAFETTKQERETKAKERENAQKEAQMLKTIGQLTMERDFLKAVSEHIEGGGIRDRRLL